LIHSVTGEAFLDELYDSDRLSHQLVNQVRTLFVFDPWRSAVLLMAGDKSGQWKQWYQAEMRRRRGLDQEQVAERMCV
jgi:hypothetical protein